MLAHGDLWSRGDSPVDPVNQVTAFDEKTGAKVRSLPADSTRPPTPATTSHVPVGAASTLGEPTASSVRAVRSGAGG